MEDILRIIYNLLKIIQNASVVVLVIWLIRLSKKEEIMLDPKPVIKIISRMKTAVFVVILITSCIQFLRPYVLDLFSYTQIAAVEIEGQTVEYCEQVNGDTGEKKLVYCIDGKCKSIDETLMSLNFTWIVYIDQGAGFEVYKESEVVEPVFSFEYAGDSYHVYLFDYFDELHAVKKDGSDDKIYNYEARTNRFVEW